MNKPDIRNLTPTRGPGKRLESWKEIAQFLNRDIRTVQRWEKEEGLPVHRLVHKDRSSVYCFESELQSWLDREPPAPSPHKPRKRGRRIKIWMWGIAAAVVLGILLMLLEPGAETASGSTSDTPFPKPITNFPGHEVNPSLSPTGTRVAFSWDGPARDNDDIYVQEIQSGEPTRLTTHSAQEFSPVWSPRGDQIAFLRQEEKGLAQVLLIDPISKRERALTELQVPPFDSGPQIAWVSDASSLVVSARLKGDNAYSLVRVDSQKGAIARITQPAGSLFGDLSPSFSPDGARLAFVRSVSPQVADVYTMDWHGGKGGDGGSPKRVTRLGTPVRGVAWVPSGNYILFSGGAWPHSALWRVNSLGLQPAEPLVVAGLSAYDPSVCVTQKLVFSRVHARRSLWRIDLSSRSAVPYLSASGSLRRPEYSRARDKMVFTSDESGYPELWLEDQQKKSTFRLTDFQATHTAHASWSPDGRHVVFDSTADGDTELFVINVNAPAPLKHEDPDARWLRQVTSNSFEDMIPRWSREGGWIYFTSNRSGEFEVWKMRSSGGEALQVTHGGGYQPLDSEDGQFLYYSKQNTDGVWRMSLRNGREDKILPGRYSELAVGATRLFMIRESSSGAHEYKLSAMDLQTLRITDEFPGQGRYGGGMTVSSDERAVVLGRYDEESADLMIVDGFHCHKLTGHPLTGLCPECAEKTSGLARVINRLTSFF